MPIFINIIKDIFEQWTVINKKYLGKEQTHTKMQKRNHNKRTLLSLKKNLSTRKRIPIKNFGIAWSMSSVKYCLPSFDCQFSVCEGS